ncbi:transcriptional regulator GlxA family with amidase domain [Saonia flava]|uniref:Transcriptional regulator GlxA family with amidase domain n=2 Tax=Saonia flava TaxID=523696 RepID=A0A846QVM5_9FLAO|nr:transcriptional regulator GlxA family with amidase domain [Saonia flava]
MLDISGILQVFQESSLFGIHYEFQYLSSKSNIITSSGITINNLKSHREFNPSEDDIICVPGGAETNLDQNEFASFFKWLRNASSRGVRICSICSGAFILAQSGLLNGRFCTTHWSLADKLQIQFPKLHVKKSILFTKDGNIYTSAGLTTGIDLALFMLEELHGSEVTAKVARELVVYVRRDGEDKQLSIFLQYRSHQHQKVHAVQDWIIQNIQQKTNLETLAEHFYSSPRNLSRIFKSVTGITITAYRNKVRVEKATNLIKNSDFKMDHIAQLCGYTNARQLRDLLKTT